MRRYALVLLATLVISVGGTSLAATYYVATNGLDTNPGTLAQPWLTLQKGVDTIAAGDTVVVMPGTYAGCRMRYSGTSGAPKTLMAQTVGTVLINAPGAVNRRQSNLEIQNNDGTSAVDYWIIDGFEVANAPSWGIDGITANYLTVRNCTVHNNGVASGRTGIFSAYGNNNLIENNESYSNGEHGIYVNNSSDNGVCRANIIRNNTSLGIHMNGDKSMGGDGQMTGWLIEKNVSYSNGSNGFDGDGVSSTTWKNNLAYNNTSKGIHLTQADGTSNPSSDRIINNTIFVPVGGYYCVNFYKGRSKTGGTNNLVENNILYNADINNSMRGSIMYISTWMATFTSNYNVVVNRCAVNDNKTKYTLAQWQSTWGKDLNSTLCLDANLLFVNQAGSDYHLTVGSPAINAGTTIADVTDDLDGNARVVPYDAGCYEY